MPNPVHRLALTLLAALTLAACGGSNGDAEPAPPPGDEPVAQVDGEPVSKALFQAFAERRREQSAQELSEEQRDELIGELVDLELLVQEAKRQGLHQDPELAGELIAQYKTTLARTLVQRELSDIEIGEEALQQAYDARVAEMDETEYKARHILVDAEDQARELIARLDEGAAFAELAREHSTGPSSEDGGDLGWFSPDQMVTPFAEAAAELEPGNYTQEPVETQFGYHVILLEDVRERDTPSLDSMRGELTEQLRRERVEEYIDGLREQAEIQR